MATAAAATSQDLIQSPPSISSSSGFPVLAVAILGIAATAFLLVSYYIFITKCCFRWQQVDPLRRFSIRSSASQGINEDPQTSFYSPSWQSRGLNELLIREIPTFQYTRRPRQGSADLSRCVVCLSEFQDNEMLRVLPKCSHAFHLDCIDVWLLSNSNCPLCRSTISGRNRYRVVERIVAPNSSPQEQQPMMMAGIVVGGQDDFVVIEISGEDGSRQGEGAGSRSSRFLVQPRSYSSRKFHHKIGKSKALRKWNHFSIMGDEGIDVRVMDEQFSIQPIRRSFSMDSAADHGVYLSVQEILRQDRLSSEARLNEESSSGSRSRRSIFSFGHGRGSRNAVLPL